MAEAIATATTQDSRIVVGNGLVLLTRRIVLWVFSAVMILFLPRYLGDAGLGQLAFAQSFAALFATVLSLGLGEFLVKEIARNRTLIDTHLTTAVGIRLVMAAVVVATVYAVSQFTHSDEARLVVYVAAATAIALSFVRLMAAVLHGLEEMSLPAMSEVASRVLVLAVGIPVLIYGMGVLAYAAVLLAATVVNLALNTTFVAKRFTLGIRIHSSRIKFLIVGGAPFILMGFLLDVYNQTDTIVLRAYTSDAVVGWYAAANNIYKAIDMLPFALTAAMLPTLSRVHASGAGPAIAMAKKGMGVGALVIIPLAVGISLFSNEIITTLPYPDEFSNTVPLLTILALTIPITAFLMILGTIAIAVDRQKAWAIALLATVILNVVLNMLAAPYFRDHYANGGIGVALTTLFSEAFMVAIGLRLMPKGVIDARLAIIFLKITVAAAVMGGVALGLKGMNAPTLSVVATAGVVYVSIALATRAVTLSDLRFIVDSAKRKLGRAST